MEIMRSEWPNGRFSSLEVMVLVSYHNANARKESFSLWLA